MAADSSERFVLLNHLADEFAARYRRGERPALQEYIDRHPELADDIREFFPALVEMEQVKAERQAVSEPTAAVPLPPLERLGDYRILREIGRGGMGVVYEAEQVSLGRHVALKVLPQKLLVDALTKRRFEREAKAAARLHHTNIVPVFGVGEHEGLPYYVMQFIPGLSLDEVLQELKRLSHVGHVSNVPLSARHVGYVPHKEVAAADVARSLLTGQFVPAAHEEAAVGRAAADATVDHTPGAAADKAAPAESPVAGRLSNTFSLSSSVVLPGTGRQAGKKPLTYWQSVARIGVQVADALDYAHKHGVKHRDIKPSNLLLDTQGTVWVTDFGLAKADDQQNLTHTGDILGTLRYMPPEAFEGRSDARGDVYSLGLTLYEFLAFRPAFDESDRNKLILQVTGAEPPRLERLNPAVPRDLATVVGKAIERDPGRRYPTAGELAADLQRFLDDAPIRARRESPWEHALRWARRRPAVAALLAVCLVAALGLLVGGWWYNAQLLKANQVADDQRREAERERQQAVTNLYHSLMREAQAIRRARESGYRAEAWKRLHQALQLETPDRDVLQLRQEAAACLGDFVGLEATATWTDFQTDILAMSLHPRGTHLALGLRDGSVQVRDLATGAETARLLAHPSPADCVAFGPDGTLFSGDWYSATVKFWEENRAGQWTCTRTLIREPEVAALLPAGAFPYFVPWLRFTDGNVRLTVTPDGKQIAAGSWRGLSVPVWDVATGNRAAPFHGDGRASPHQVAFSPDGRLMAAGYNASGSSITGPHGVWVWEAASRQLKHTLSPDLGDLHQVCFSPDGRLLASACGEGVAVYDTSHFERSLFVRGDSPESLAFSPDSRLLAIAATHARLVRLWDVGMNREVARLRLPGEVSHLAYSSDGSVLVAASDRIVRIWNLAGSGEKLVLAGHGAGIPGLAFSPDGKHLVSAGGDKRVRFWDPATGRLVRELTGFRDRVQAVAFSPDGSLLATGDWAGGLQVWDVESGQRLAAPDHGLRSVVWSVAFSPDGRYLAACGEEDANTTGGVVLSRVVPKPAHANPGARFELQGITRLSDHPSTCLAFSADSELLAWVQEDDTLHLWDLVNSREVQSPVPRIGGYVHSVTFAPPGKRAMFVAAAKPEAWDRTEAWDLATGKQLFSLAGGMFRERPGIAFGRITALSSDGARFAWLGSRVTVWDTASQQLQLALPESQSSIWCLALSPNQELVAVGSSDGGLEIWNLPRIRSQLASIGLGW